MLETLSEIREKTPSEIYAYAGFLEEHHEWERSEVLPLMFAVQHTPVEALPVPDTVLVYLCQFLTDNYYDNDDNLKISDIVETRVFSSDNVAMYRWTLDGHDHTVFINRDDIEFLVNLTNRLIADEDVSDLYLLRFGTSVLSLPPLSALSTDIVEYMRMLDIITTPNYLEPNSESIEVKENTARFSGAMWYEAIQQKVITLAGVGGIGSYVGFMLARMNPKSIFVYDDDRVEAVNMSGQFYGRSDIGNYKADALAATVRNYADYNSIFSITQRFTEETSASDIMICGFDNMDARRIFFRKWLAHIDSKPIEERKHCLFIDGRLAAEDLQVLCITGDNYPDIERYDQEFLFTDEEADETVCSYKQTTYMANMIGSIIINLFTNFVANELVGAPIRSLPFFTAYDGISMRIKNE